jgi:hypothetical protein
MVRQRSAMNSRGWNPELTMRWSAPISSSRAYCEIAQKRSLA